MIANLGEARRPPRKSDLRRNWKRTYPGALNNLIAVSRRQRCYERFDGYSQEAAVFFQDHDLGASELCLIGDVVEALSERGRLVEATPRARSVVVRRSVHGRVQCVAVLGRLAGPRGEPDPFAYLDEALSLRESFGGARGGGRLRPCSQAGQRAAQLAIDPR